MAVQKSVSNSHDDFDRAFYSSSSAGKILFTESSFSPESTTSQCFSPSGDLASSYFFKDCRKVHIAHLSEAASRPWRFYLNYLSTAVEHSNGNTYSTSYLYTYQMYVLYG